MHYVYVWQRIHPISVGEYIQLIPLTSVGEYISAFTRSCWQGQHGFPDEDMKSCLKRFVFAFIVAPVKCVRVARQCLALSI